MPLSADACSEIRRLLAGKATNLRYAEVARYLHQAGWEPAGRKGSHETWRGPSGRRLPLVDHGAGELLPVYVKRAIRAILDEGGCP